MLLFLLVITLLFDSNMVILAEELAEIIQEHIETQERVPTEEYDEGNTSADVEAMQNALLNDNANIAIDIRAEELRGPEIKDVQSIDDEYEKLYGKAISIEENQKIYQVDATNYITVISSEAYTYVDESGKTKQIDNNLIARDMDTKEQTTILSKEQALDDTIRVEYTNAANNVETILPANITEDEGIEIRYDGKVLEIFPEEGTYGKAIVEDNAILYNHVHDGIDVQYTIGNTGIKEDIILRKEVEKESFTYYFSADKYNAKLEDNQVFVYEKGNDEVAFVLSAPLMEDANLQTSTNIEISLEKKQGNYHLTITPDASWLRDVQRAYPIKIDPTITVPTDNLVQVTTSTVHGVYQGTGYGYAGYITSAMTGIPGARDIGRSRMYFSINYDFRGQIPAEGRIDSATLNVYQYRQYDITNATFACYKINSPWNPSSLTWNNAIELSLEPSGQNSTSSPAVGMHQFDIRESVNSWVQGLSPNYGLVVMATDETRYGGAFYTPYSTGTAGQTDFTWDKRPHLTINWSVPDPVDENFGLNDTTVDLRTMISTNRTGKLQFQGVIADGTATPGSNVSYALNDASKGYSATVPVSYSYKYPDTSAFDSLFETGTTKYKDKLGNWQTLYPFTEPVYNDLYKINAQATKGGVTGNKKESETFVIYKVTRFDTLPKIANYYGVTLDQIMFDNRVQDMLLMENNTLFIRNPQKNANTPYNPPPLTDDEKMRIDAQLMGRGLHCEFEFEPININTGNFYMSREDVSIPDYLEDFKIERSYNSKGAAYNSVFGRGWQFPYSEQISKDEDGNIFYTLGDGGILRFTPNADGSYNSPQGYELILEQKEIDEKSYDFGKGEEKYPVYEYSITDAQMTRKTFNYFGVLCEIEDIFDNKTTLDYDANYNLKKITSPGGSSYQFRTDIDGKIISIQLPNGSFVSYAYDDNDNLVSFTDPVGAVIRYAYDDKHQMSAWYDGEGICIIENEYDSEGRVTKQIDANGGITTLTYETGKTTTIDANHNKVVYHYDSLYRTTKIEHPDGTSVTKTYNDKNQLSSETNELNHTTTYAYDANGNLSKETRFDGKSRTWNYRSDNQIETTVGFDGVKRAYTYNALHMPQTLHVNDKLRAEYTYDEQGRILSQTDATGNKTTYQYTSIWVNKITDPKGNVTNISYNPHGLPTSIVDAKNGVTKYMYDAEGRRTGTQTPEGIYTETGFDLNGQVIYIKDGNGNRTTFQYDNMGNRISGDGGSGNLYSYTYDALGNLLSERTPAGQTLRYTYDSRNRQLTRQAADGGRTTYQYDKLGNPISVTDALGYTTTYQYDYANEKISEIVDAKGDATEFVYTDATLASEIKYADGTSEKFGYDDENRLIKHIDAKGLETTYALDKNGNVLKESTDNRESTYTYDALNQRTSFTLPSGGKVTYAYDAVGNLKTITDPLGGKSHYEYSSSGYLLSNTDALGNKTTYEYDNNGNMAKYNDALGNTTVITYNAYNQPVVSIDALGNQETYSYNGDEQLMEIEDALGNSISYEYNSLGLPAIIRDKNGNEHTITYDKNGNQEKITAPDGTYIKYTYDVLNQLIKEQDSFGLITEYEYDTNGQVIREWDSMGMDNVYEYDALGNCIKERNALEESTEYVYNKFGELTQIKEANGNITKMEYDIDGQVILIKDAERKNTRFTYDANGQLIKQTDNSNRIWQYEYDAIGQATKEQDPKGQVTTYTYDALGSIIKVKDARGNSEQFTYDPLGQITNYTDKNGNSTSIHYDALGRMVQGLTAEGGKEQYTYDANGNTISYTDPLGNKTEYTYNHMNRMVSEKLPNGGFYKYHYNQRGVATKITDPLGNVTTAKTDLYGQTISRTLPNQAEYTYTYDVLGRITNQSAPQGLHKDYTYDNSGNLMKETDHEGREIAYTYDKMNRLLTITNPLKQKTSYTYDKNGNLKSATTPKGNKTTYTHDVLDQLEEIKDPVGKKTLFHYDATGNVNKISINNERNTEYTYDANDNVTSIKNALDEVTTYTYDTMNRVRTITDAANKSTRYRYNMNNQMTAIIDGRWGRTSYTYDANGNISSIADGEGRRVAYTYDLLDRIVDTKMGTGLTESHIQYEYDNVGNMTRQTDGEGHVTQYEYDQLSNVTSKTNALGEIETYEYDIHARLSKITQPNASTIQYDYNKLDALISIDYSDESDGQVLYAYDTDGRRVSMTDLTGETSYEYDNMGRITGVQDGNGNVILYNYDSFGNLNKLTYPDGTEVLYGYDSLDRLVSVTDRENGETTYDYDVSGNMTAVNRANGTKTDVTYDANNQVETVKNRDKIGILISSYEYTYDHAGYITMEMIRQDKETKINFYTYDDAGQLESVTVNDVAGNELEKVSYVYDKAGNRVQVIASEDVLQESMLTSVTNSYNEVNQLIRSTDHNGTTEYIYDANGNRIEELAPNERVREYQYDTENRLIAVRDEQGLLMSALYDGDDNRVFRASRTTKTATYELKSPKTSAQGEKADIFWYGFGQSFVQSQSADKSSMGEKWDRIWEDIISAYHRKIAKDRADEEGIVVNPQGITNVPGEGDVTYASDYGQTLIPYGIMTDEYYYYEIDNYINDINREHTQVLGSYDEMGTLQEVI